ncbi:hypothetical protein [Exiguobacterium oxidotolerans]|uniref:Uncharacterized protein n=2 Tax=Exiguobacterium TaxID=33986 RepID=A0A653I8B1_9BACL|nr:hypothetical protein [Exiguobacterium oxidotolerans]VWX35287.1 exported hypothetical protein [Exiguobacterium oxidotolerans]
MKRTLMVGLSAALLSSSLIPTLADAKSNEHRSHQAIKHIEFLS